MRLKENIFLVILFIFSPSIGAQCNETPLSVMQGKVFYTKSPKEAFFADYDGYHKTLLPKHRLLVKDVYRASFKPSKPICVDNQWLNTFDLAFDAVELMPKSGHLVSLGIQKIANSKNGRIFKVTSVESLSKASRLLALGNNCRLIDELSPAEFEAKLEVSDDPSMPKNVLYPGNFTLHPTSTLCTIYRTSLSAGKVSGLSVGDIYQIPLFGFDMLNVPVRSPAFINQTLNVKAKLVSGSHDLELVKWQGTPKWQYHSLMCYLNGKKPIDLSGYLTAYENNKAVIQLPYTLCLDEKIMTRLTLPVDKIQPKLQMQHVNFRVVNERITFMQSADEAIKNNSDSQW